jgi:hypothetical protein
VVARCERLCDEPEIACLSRELQRASHIRLGILEATDLLERARATEQEASLHGRTCFVRQDGRCLEPAVIPAQRIVRGEQVPAAIGCDRGVT